MNIKVAAHTVTHLPSYSNLHLMHQSFVSPPPPPGTGDSGGIAGLKCWGLTSDVSRQCRGCAGVLTSRQYSGEKSCSSSIQFCYILVCVYQVGNKRVCRNCNVSKVCPLPLLYATFTDIFGLCQHSLIHFLHFLYPTTLSNINVSH